MGEIRYKQRLAVATATTLWLMLLCGLGLCNHPLTPTPTPKSQEVSAAVPATRPRPLVAIPSASRSLAGKWGFAIDPSAIGHAAGWFDPSFDDTAWAVVTVPHTWNVMPEHADYAGLAWYRRRRGSWSILRDEYAPVLIDAVSLLPRTAERQSALLTLRTRGPVEHDLPAYTGYGYQLHWVVTGSEDRRMLSEGHRELPTLTPGMTWVAHVEWPTPTEDYVLTFSVVRPTGATVLERSYDSGGDVRQNTP
jgi:hypothetical protein